MYFDKDGLCAACLSYKNRKSVDWEQRQSEFISMVKEVNKESESEWDCIVPVSGGKDSTAQVLKMLELGFKPLCVTATTCDLTEIGKLNIENIKSLGVDHVQFSPNPVVRRKLNQLDLN